MIGDVDVAKAISDDATRVRKQCRAANAVCVASVSAACAASAGKSGDDAR